MCDTKAENPQCCLLHNSTVGLNSARRAACFTILTKWFMLLNWKTASID